MSAIFAMFYRGKLGHTSSQGGGPKLNSKDIVESQIWAAGLDAATMEKDGQIFLLWLRYLCIQIMAS